jgi:tRNA threonylcarbamoyladenosine biosynthesis protein TsaB
MRVLGFDTATRATAVALCGTGSDERFEARDDPTPGARPGHGSLLLPLVARVMAEAGAAWADIDRIAVGVGPGTFTGLRIGIATARALAIARGLPLVGVSTLESVALTAASSAAARDAEIILAVLDARRREVFAAAWRRTGDRLGERLLEPVAIAPDALGDWLTEHRAAALAVGDGAVEFRGVLERSGTAIPDDGSGLHKVTAITHCVLARELDPRAPDDVRPEYIRLPDAEVARRQQTQR